MRTYKLNDDVVVASTDAGIIEELRKASWQSANSTAEFMKAMAQRAKLQTGRDVRTDSAENFVGDLVRCGVLKEVK